MAGIQDDAVDFATPRLSQLHLHTPGRGPTSVDRHMLRQSPDAEEQLDIVADILQEVSQQLTQHAESQEATQRSMDIVESVIRLLCDSSVFQDLHHAEIMVKLNEALDLLRDDDNGFRSVTFDMRGPGRPAFHIPEEQLQTLIEYGFKVPEIAALFGVSVRTIFRRMRNLGLRIFDTYSSITDEDLRKEIADFHAHCPTAGYRVTWGYLSSKGIRVQRHRVMASLRAVDPLGTIVRGLQHKIISRRPYKVPAPLSLWHIDGNHKLIRWRIVVHGGIDGYSRKIMFLQANDNNRASTVFRCFLAAVTEFGLPDRTRSDKGGENIDVAKFMLEYPARGPERRSHITGKSVHNQRIERLWRDLWVLITGNYYTAFRHLESIGALEPDNDLHILCLHHIMLPRINMHLDLFRLAWDNHPMSSESNKSPEQLWLSGLLMNERPLPEEVPADDTFGIDWDGPVAPNDIADTVTVPEAELTMKTAIEAALHEAVDPNQPSTSFGCDLYIKATEVVKSAFGPLLE